VISPATAATMTTIMEGVTERGTATLAKIDRYQVAGKTGTAHKVVDGHYSDSAFNASFVGFVPSRKPAYTILVVIDTPRGGSHYGGPVAAPIFKRVAEALLQIGGVKPSIDPAPSILVNASAVLIPARPRGTDVVEVVTPVGGRPVMPDVRGLGARDALRAISAVGLAVRIDGDGRVVSQLPAPGEPIESGGSSTITLRREPADPRSTGGSR
jgi:membrane peptidoglycan carboxypeptidase